MELRDRLLGPCATNESSPHGDILHTCLYLSRAKRRKKKNKRESRILRSTGDCMGVELMSEKKRTYISAREK